MRYSAPMVHPHFRKAFEPQSAIGPGYFVEALDRLEQVTLVGSRATAEEALRLAREYRAATGLATNVRRGDILGLQDRVARLGPRHPSAIKSCKWIKLLREEGSVRDL